MPADTMPTPAGEATSGADRSAPVDLIPKDRLRDELAGLDALEAGAGTGTGTAAGARRLWSGTWPRLAAVAVVLVAWQLLDWSDWKPDFALPGPGRVLPLLVDLVGTSEFWAALATTMRRAVSGFAVSIVLGTLLGVAVTRSRILRRAVGSLITGLQTMPSITWFPLAILLFQLSEQAILFVVVLGAAPSIANGLIGGVDHIPPLYLRAARAMGARGFTLLRSVVLPAALPGYVGGLKQGWAFAWRSLMAGELLVIIGSSPSLGVRMDFARQFSDTPLLLAYMLVILVIGIVVDALFNRVETGIRARRGLVVTD